MRRVIIALAATTGVIGVALGQDPASTPVVAPGGTMVINTAPPVPERDKCLPLNARLDADRCESLLSPTRTIYMQVGTKQTLRFDRPFARVEIDASPEGSLDIVWADSNTVAILEARTPGVAELYFFGDVVGRGGLKVRDVLAAITVSTLDRAPPAALRTPPIPPVPPHVVQVHRGKSVQESTTFHCLDDGGCDLARPGRR